MFKAKCGLGVIVDIINFLAHQQNHGLRHVTGLLRKYRSQRQKDDDKGDREFEYQGALDSQVVLQFCAPGLAFTPRPSTLLVLRLT